MKIQLQAKGPYDFRRVVFSHGWSDLVPFYVEDTKGTVCVGIRAGSQGLAVRVSAGKNGIVVECERKFSQKTIQDLQYIFRLDEDLGPFYTHAKKYSRQWIVKDRMGRLLRSQTVFEDLIKMVLTTNCSWALTRYMTDALGRHLGKKIKEGLYLFPTVEALASKPEQFFRDKIHAGYRSPYLPKIAKLTLKGDLTPEAWKTSKQSPESIRKEILKVPGAGPYVADTMLKLLGRCDYLGLDSWARGSLKKLWNMKKNPSDKTIARRYKEHGKYQGLILWCDLTKGWLKDEELAALIRTRNRLNA